MQGSSVWTLSVANSTFYGNSLPQRTDSTALSGGAVAISDCPKLNATASSANTSTTELGGAEVAVVRFSGTHFDFNRAFRWAWGLGLGAGQGV